MTYCDKGACPQKDDCARYYGDIRLAPTDENGRIRLYTGGAPGSWAIGIAGSTRIFKWSCAEFVHQCTQNEVLARRLP